MDWLTFFSQIVRAIAWPVASVVVVWLLRNELRGLLRRLERLSGKSIEAVFAERELTFAALQLTEGQPQDVRAEAPAERGAAESLALALIDDPEKAVAGVWNLVGEKLIRLATTHALAMRDGKAIALELAKRGVISSTLFGTIDSLYGLRNAKLGAGLTMMYADIADSALEQLRALPQ